MIIGILGMQGNLEEHTDATLKAMGRLGIAGRVIVVKDEDDLWTADGLIITGGESTTMWKLLKEEGLFEGLRKFDKPVFGTCAGLVLLAREGADKDSKKTSQEFLKRIDAVVNRNAFGRQRESFSVDLDFDGKPFHAVFIRAPAIEGVGKGVEVLARFEGRIVAARAGGILVTAFHPELTEDTRIHEYFLKMI
jgi:5'-phosphate synthase pdxT subunit